MMDSLLQHMVTMTGYRDHSMLDISVISAVQELVSASQTRILALSTVRGQATVRSRAVICCGSAARMEEYPDPATGCEKLESYPALEACIAQRQSSVEVIGADGTHTLWLPIWIGDCADASFEITGKNTFDSDTLQMIAGVVSVYRNFQNLLDYSERDSLTGLLNRKTFDDQLAKMLHGCSTCGTSATPVTEERRRHDDAQKQWLAVVDIDHFKLVNDKFGHLYGDEVLILIANLMQSSFRSNDRVFRFGGEEFVILLRSATLENVHKVIDRFRTNVEKHDFPQVGQVTVSIGFVSISATEAPVVILGRADQALYYAKSHGRNMACHYDQLISEGALLIAESNDTAEFF
jgi:diguanylate cyclase (GGDEF)-like protein